MKAQIWSYIGEQVADVRSCEVDDDYDGDPYGDKVHFTVGSNQQIITDPDLFMEEL
jgi:hypothetical protein